MIRRTKISASELTWQSVVFIAITYSTIEAPLRFVLNLELTPVQIFIDTLIAIVFGIDLFNNIKIRRKLRTKTFYRRHFPKRNPVITNISIVIDVFSLLPFNLIAYYLGGPYLAVVSVLKIFRIFKMANMFTLVGNITLLPSIIKVQFTVMLAVIAINLIACGWILIYPMPADSFNTYTYYNKSLYWAVTTLTTIGYGDITPVTNVGRMYTMIIMILGLGVYGLVIGNISKIISRADRYKEQYRERVNDLGLFMRHYDIPDQLQYASYSYYNHLFTKRLSDNDSKIISELPNALQAELQIYMNLKLIGNVPAFKGCSHNCMKDIASSLDQMYFSPGQNVIHKGEVGSEMYIIGHGVIEVIVKDRTVASTLHEGQCFGETALLEESKRNATMRASTYCDLYKLSKEDFLNIIKRHPELLKAMKKSMTRRITDRTG